MNARQQALTAMVDKHKDMILEAERWIWAHPQTGYKEWEANDYLAEKYEALGYTLVRAGNIPGFYTDIDTGKPGPRILVLGELDALYCETHPEARDGVAHACGHNAQSAALLGFAAALKEPGALDGLCGSVRLMAVPAEELIEIEYRESLRKQGIIRFFGGKAEFMARGYMDGCDIAFMLHTGGGTDVDYSCGRGMNGCVAKTITYRGKAAHAGGGPHNGINALYAASLGMQAVNSLRETFKDDDHIRFHPIMTGGGTAVNVIPAEGKLESYVRGASVEAIKAANVRINRALTGAALSMGAGVELVDRPGYAPMNHDPNLRALAQKVMGELVGPERVSFTDRWGTGCTDMGDVSAVMPAIHPSCAGAAGTGHGMDYQIADPYRACCNAAKFYMAMTDELLRDDAAAAKAVIAQAKPLYPSIQAYLEDMQNLILDKNAVVYDENGNVTVDFKN